MVGLSYGRLIPKGLSGSPAVANLEGYGNPIPTAGMLLSDSWDEFDPDQLSLRTRTVLMNSELIINYSGVDNRGNLSD